MSSNISAAANSSVETRFAKLIRRREAIFICRENHPQGSSGHYSDQIAAIALSGGGIRSATYTLGGLQAIARAPSDATTGAAPVAPAYTTPGEKYLDSFISRFDYLSTVSGGGYMGSFVASLFIPGRLTPNAAGSAPPALSPTSSAAIQAADNAVAVLSVDPPGRISSGKSGGPLTQETFPLAWLRENGRYLSPTGAGDMAYVAALQFRNWLAVHYVVGTLLMAAFALVALTIAFVLPAMKDFCVFGKALSDFVPISTAQDQTFTFWYSPVLALSVVAALLLALPLIIAYWFTYPTRNSRFNYAIACAVLLDVFLIAMGYLDNHTAQYLSPAGYCTRHVDRKALIHLGIIVLTLAILAYPLLRSKEENGNRAILETRIRMTRWLMRVLQLIVGIILLGIIETMGQSFYLHSIAEGANGPAFSAIGLSGSAAILAGIVNRLAKFFSNGHVRKWSHWVPVTVFCGAIGIAIFLLLACFWDFAIQWLVWNGNMPSMLAMESSWPARILIFLSLLVFVFATGQFPGFLNLSSLHSFYSSRLTRAYLGASNKARIPVGRHAPAGSAAEPAPGDDIELSTYLNANKTGPINFAPFHIINATLNRTIDPAEQLVQRDRKGQPFAVMATGFSVDGVVYQFKAEPWKEIQQPLSVGRWVGVSGAAVSTGIGRASSLGMSLLLGAANVRLGTWWESQAGRQDKENYLGKIFKTQSYLYQEFTAKFYGMRRKWQYLSDGGHFENTGLYELLRPERNIRFVIAFDCGADPNYEFSDLANLIRLVRIDHKIEVEVCEAVLQDPVLSHVFTTPEKLRADVKQMRAPGRVNNMTQCAILLRVIRPQSNACSWVVLIKPTLLENTPDDVKQYALKNPAFPNESTADQFFDEAQWESYRKLGLSNTEAVLSTQIRQALSAYTGVAI